MLSPCKLSALLQPCFSHPVLLSALMGTQKCCLFQENMSAKVVKVFAGHLLYTTLSF